MKRSYGRNADQLRPLSITYNFFDFAAGSVLLKQGKTKVACAVNLQPSVPFFMKGKKTGWLTAEYAMLPAATKQRTDRESSSFKRNNRSVEISRLIGRSFRSVIDLDVIGERTIIIDCDVLQADGSTRTVCITGAYFALKSAQDKWLESGLISRPFLKHELAAVSIGLKGDQVLLDIDYAEDSSIDADFNFVLTTDGAIIEMQGSGEKYPIPWPMVMQMQSIAQKGVASIYQQISIDNETSQICGSKSRPVFNKIRLKELNQ